MKTILLIGKKKYKGMEKDSTYQKHKATAKYQGSFGWQDVLLG
jgi:hypothetical protein